MAQKAWAISTGSTSIRVGVIDSGINAHPELSSNLNSNLNEAMCDMDYSETIDIDDARTVMRIATGIQSYVR